MPDTNETLDMMRELISSTQDVRHMFASQAVPCRSGSQSLVLQVQASTQVLQTQANTQVTTVEAEAAHATAGSSILDESSWRAWLVPCIIGWA